MFLSLPNFAPTMIHLARPSLPPSLYRSFCDGDGGGGGSNQFSKRVSVTAIAQRACQNPASQALQSEDDGNCLKQPTVLTKEGLSGFVINM